MNNLLRYITTIACFSLGLINTAEAQQERFIGVIGNALVEVNPFNPEISLITEINLPAGFNLRSIAYYPDDCLFYTIYEGGTDPQLAAIDWEGNFINLGPIQYNAGTISIAEGIAYNSNDNQVYISGSLDGSDFGSESIFTIDLDTRDCTFITTVETQENLFDIDNMVFVGNTLYFNDVDPGPSITKFYELDITAVGPSVTLSDILTISANNSSDIVVFRNEMFFTSPGTNGGIGGPNDFLSFELNTTVVQNLGPTHTSADFNGSLLRGLEFVQDYVEFDYTQSLGLDLTFCEGESDTLMIDAEGYDVLWSTGETSSSIEITEAGVYSVQVIFNECPIFTSEEVTVKMGEDTDTTLNVTICDGDFFDYQGESIETEGIYTFDLPSTTGCDSIINLIVSLTPPIIETLNFEICEGEEIEVNGILYMIGNYSQIIETNGCDTLLNILIDTLAFEECIDCAGIYNGDAVIDECGECLDPNDPNFNQTCNDCAGVTNGSSVIDLCGLCLEPNDPDFNATCNICPIYIPNAFTPNNDGDNDFFRVFSCPENNREIKNLFIYNRWGNLVFELSDLRIHDPNQKWDGLYKNREAPIGVYTYLVEFPNTNSEQSIYTGSITLVR